MIEGDTVVVPAFEGKFPAANAGAFGESGRRGKIADPPALKKLVLDRRTGERLGETPMAPEPGERPRAFVVQGGQHLCDPFRFYSLGEIFSPPAPRRIFPGKAASVRMSLYIQDDYWFHSDREPPVQIVSAGEESGCRIIPFELDHPLMLSWNETVLESIGGGVVLVKDLADGQGLKRLSPVRLDRGQ